MKKSNNSLNSLMKQLGQSGNRAQSLTDLTRAVTLPGSRSSRPAGSKDQTRTSISGPKLATGIDFGRAPVTKTSASTGTDWKGLINQAASGGIASAFGGGSLLSNFTGLGSLVSGITSLFGGGKKTLPPLVGFQLPASQNETLYVGKQTTAYSGVAEVGVSQQQGNGSYQAPSSGAQTTQDQSMQIAQAVKTALLHSSSLNDVIAEI